MNDTNQNQLAAIITGASSGIGLAISKRLAAIGYKVFGIGRNFANHPLWQEEMLHPIICDLLDTELLCKYIRQIKSQNQIHVLVNNAGVGYYGLHEELNPKKIQELVRTNLEVPMILSQQLLRELKKNAGHIINIASVTAYKSNPHGCAYGATKAGLASFSASLFDEARKYGVKVATVSPDMTQTNLYRNANFCEGNDPDTYLLPEEVANAVAFILNQRDGMTITELTLKPQRHQIKKMTTQREEKKNG